MTQNGIPVSNDEKVCTEMQTETGKRAPAVTLKAIGHGRQVDISKIGVPAVLIFAGRETSPAVRPVIEAVRDRYPAASQVVIATIADVRSIPRLVRKVAETLMKSNYKESVDRLVEGRTPEEYVLIFPDWDGAVYKPLGVEDVTQSIAIAVLDADGSVIEVSQGDGAPEQALATLSSVVA